MKKRNLLLITGLIIPLAFWLAGCSALEAKKNTANSGETPTGKSGFSQFIPFLNTNPSKDEAQSTPNANSVALNATAIVTPGETPAPTLFWPTPDGSTFATPYVPPTGDDGQTLPPEQWQEWPVIPVISDHAVEIYRAGIAQGNDPGHFSKVGDCQNIRQYFLGIFDDPSTFRLGDKNAYLQETIDTYAGSWGRTSEAVHTGFNVASVLTPLFANPENCQPGETPLACEFRIWNPSIVTISMETWTSERPTRYYEVYLRQIVEYAISQNVLPIVATKADNLEGDNAINQMVAKVAADYDIPMWNFWAAAQPLTDHGLTEDGFHLTNGYSHFDSATSMDLGWPVRNLTALMTIDAVRKAVK